MCYEHITDFGIWKLTTTVVVSELQNIIVFSKNDESSADMTNGTDFIIDRNTGNNNMTESR